MKHTTLPSSLDVELNYSEDSFVGHSLSGGGFYSGTLEELASEFGGYYAEREIPELLSNRRKYLVLFNLAYFHSIMDTLTLIFKVKSLEPEMLFVVYVDSTQVGNSEVFPYMLKVLEHNGVEFVVVETPADVSGTGIEHIEHPIVSRAKNFSYLKSERDRAEAGFDPTLVDVRYAFDRVREFAVKSSGSGSGSGSGRKVYLSRKKVSSFYLPPEIAAEYLGYTSDIRVSEEEVLEGYLAGLGFDIVCPEDFADYAEQVRYMSEVEVLVSGTGSGLMNLGLMPDAGLVVELRCELLFGNIGGVEIWEPYQILIGEYADISYIKGHTHILIANRDVEKSGSDMVDALKKLGLERILV